MSFSFGTSMSAPPAATTATTGFSFGSTTITPVQSQPQQPQQPQQQQQGFSFGVAKPTAVAAPQNAAVFSLGASVPASQPATAVGAAPASTGFSFATASQPQPAATASTSVGGFSFGAATTAAAASQPSGFSLGTQSLGTTGGATPAFGTTLTATTAITTSAAAPTSATLSFGFSTASVATTSSATSTAATTAAAPIRGLGGQLATTTTSTAIGIGTTGVGVTGANVGPGQQQKGGKVKDVQVPNEVVQTVEIFKKFVKEEKSVSSDIAHTSSKLHQKITNDIATLNSLVKSLAAGLSRSKASMDRLKIDAAQELLNVEIAQRTRDTPPALQYENVAPYAYFERLAAGFEAQMAHYRSQIDETERHLRAAASASGSGATGGGLSAVEIVAAMQKLQASFTNLAGRFQKIHDAVEQQKEVFLQINRHKYGRDGSIFKQSSGLNTASVSSVVKSASRIPTHYVGPSPFSGQPDLLTKVSLSSAAVAAPTAQQQKLLMPSSSAAPPPQFGLNSSYNMGFGQASNSLGGVGSNFSSVSQQPQQGLLGNSMSPFASGAQQPLFQTGGKRGKH